MAELLLLLLLAGLVLASGPRMGFCNPFQIYFLMWAVVLAAYCLFESSFIAPSLEFFLLMAAAKGIALVILLTARLGLSRQPNPISAPREITFREPLIKAAQVVVILAAPLAYLKAVQLSGGESIFSIAGYIRLRASMTEDGERFGLLAYVSILSYLLASMTAVSFFAGKVGRLRFALSLVAAFFYVYLGTGRTAALLLIFLLLVPLIVLKAVTWKGAIASIGLFALIFIFMAAMTAKGVLVESDWGGNLESLLKSLRSYGLAPLLAFSQLVEIGPAAEWGLHTFRFPMSVLHAMQIVDQPPVALIREYAYVPDPTNVYTAYDVYFRDFGYFGLLGPPLFLVFHWWLYRKAVNEGSQWIFYYAAFVYPLLMQFFQDQYFSLLSIWIQIGLWCLIFIGPRRGPSPMSRVAHA